MAGGQMLRNDPIVSKYPHFLPTEKEVALAEEMIRSPEHTELFKALHQVAIAGDVNAALWRLCWQARESHKVDEECAAGALEWLRKCLEARSRLGMDTVLKACPISKEFRDLYTATIPFSCHGVDKEGHPIYITRYGSVDVDAFEHLWAAGEALRKSCGLAVNAVVLVYLRVMEYISKVVMAQETSRRGGAAVDRILAIMDLRGIGFGHLTGSMKGFLSAVKSESVPLYPETLHATVVVGVPWLLSKAAWPMVKVFMNPVTQAKFKLTTSDAEASTVLGELVDPENTPPYLGGACSCEECLQGHLQGGTMWHWEEAHGLHEGTALA